MYKNTIRYGIREKYKIQLLNAYVFMWFMIMKKIYIYWNILYKQREMIFCRKKNRKAIRKKISRGSVFLKSSPSGLLYKSIKTHWIRLLFILMRFVSWQFSYTAFKSYVEKENLCNLCTRRRYNITTARSRPFTTETENKVNLKFTRCIVNRRNDDHSECLLVSYIYIL